MQLVLEKRVERSGTIALVSPLIAVGLTIVTMIILFTILGKNPLLALYAYFIAPLTDGYSLQEIAVKATPLVMIAGGVGIAPLLGMLEEAAALGDRRSFRLLYAARNPSALAGLAQLRELHSSLDLLIHCVVDEGAKSGIAPPDLYASSILRKC